MHRSYVRLLYPDNMMQLPYIVASNGPHKFVTLPNKIFKLMFIISRLKVKINPQYTVPMSD